MLTAQGYVQSSDGTITYLVTKNLVEEGRLSIEESYPLNAAAENSPSPLYSKYGLGISIAAIPLYCLGKLLSLILSIDNEFATKFMVAMLNPLVTAVTCSIVFQFGIKMGYTTSTSCFLSLIYGLTTTTWVYSETFMTEPLSTLFLLLSVYFIYNINDDVNEKKVFLSSFFVSLAIITKSANIIYLPVVSLYLIHLFFKRNSLHNFFRTIFIYSLPIAISFIVVFFYNYLRYKNILSSGYEGEGFSTNIFVGLYGLLLSPGKSFFLYNPLLILSFVGFYFFWKIHRDEALLFISIILITMATSAMWHTWAGGWGWGPRFLVVIIPFFVLPSGYVIEKLWDKKTVRYFTVLAFTLGMLIQISGINVSFSRYYYELRHKYGDEADSKLYYSLHNTPLLHQWVNVWKVWNNLHSKDYLNKIVHLAKNKKKFYGAEDTTILEEGLSLNVPNFWWIYAWLYGIPKWLIISSLVFLFTVIISSGKIIITSLKQNRTFPY